MGIWFFVILSVWLPASASVAKGTVSTMLELESINKDDAPKKDKDDKDCDKDKKKRATGPSYRIHFVMLTLLILRRCHTPCITGFTITRKLKHAN